MAQVPLLTVTFIRHGESTDNPLNVWAGWRDSPLSNHGMSQARALGEAFADTRLAAIHASPLKRAFSTAQCLYDAQPEPKPSFTTSLLLREQHFGIAEGHPWLLNDKPGLTLEEHLAQGLYPVLHQRWQKFPEGESLNDLAARASQAVDDIILPYAVRAARAGIRGVHIALVSHGLCLSEVIPALLRKDASGRNPGHHYRGLLNTAWTRVTIDIKGYVDREPLELADNDLPPFNIQLTHHNQAQHLDKLKRQPGGIGSAAYDPKQKDIRAFFAGVLPVVPDHQHEEGRSESNAEDEAEVEIHNGGD